ncbi:MAG TPA: tripartite tricarboxylate transporter substrate binding protein [Geminicoccaceae bacterium]|nr:tripartite tricarboxylate transporter substrate binding protein [Geminicoccus sp.]HMU51365.1 tripartite tricarboxylate transporter substrate binding protein [Geminicoccaceae bacterium]
MLRRQLLLSSLLATLPLGRQALAAYPEKAIRVIVPTATGGSIDMNARLFERTFETSGLLPQPLTIVNVTGAAGSVGLRQIKDSAPDGYTIGIWHNGLVLASIMGVIDFDHTAFDLICQTGSSALGIGAKAGGPFADAEALVAAAKASPDSVKAAVNIGLPVHVIALMFARAAGVRFRYVQTGGGSQRLASILGGHTDFSGFSPQELIQYQGSGLKPLLVFAPERVPQLPDVPTARELGWDLEWVEERFWIAPKGTDPERVTFMADSFEKAMALPETVKWFEEQAITPSFSRGPAAAERLVAVAAKIQPIAGELKQPAQ